jgi:undecaprenyl-phosphate 4-deoxy-4-formamido-L-arabinose transferase
MNSSSIIEYSVVVPVYNSNKTLRELFTRIRKVLDSLEKTFEVIFIEDCGSDKSWDVLCELKKEFPDHVTAIKLSKNFGQHNAIMCGFNFAKGQWIITIDDDLQIPPEEIPKLIDHAFHQQSELVYGVYGKKKHNIFRNLGSACIQQIFKTVFKSKGPITSFRLIRSQLIDKIKGHSQSFVFIDGVAHWHTQYISRVQVNHYPRSSGESGYTLSKLLRLSSNLLLNFTTLPLRFITYLGLAVAVFSFVTGFVFLIRKFLYDVPMGYTSIIVTIFFTGGIILLVMGILGEYVSRIYQLQNDKPQYSIKEIQ